MAVNKRKVLDAARKYAQKGAKEKALKEYHTLLKLDPRDAKLHLEIGDCYRRWGQIDEAVTQYTRVAEQYKGDGFDARAVAVFKQILNLDPKAYTAYVSLGELYQRMGLEAEALGALQSAADGYHKEGQKREALELLRRMATLDPTNTTSRLKVAELLRQEGMEADAVSEFEAVAAELSKQGAIESYISVQEKILELQPERPDVLLGVAQALIDLKRPERAEPFARGALAKDPENANVHELLCELYKTLGKDKELAAATRQLAQVYRDRGQDDKARELAQRIPMAFELEVSSEPSSSADVTESAFLGDDELLDDDFLETGEPDELELDDEPDEVLLDDEHAPEPPPSRRHEPAPPPRVDPESDPDQLFAEASVYLRYGKRDQAIASLEALLQQDPEHRGALEKLGDAYADADDAGEAVSCWSRAAKLAQREEDDAAFDVLRDRIAALDAAAADALGSAPASGLDDEPEPESLASDLRAGAEDTRPDIDDGFEVELDLGVDAEDEFEIDAPGDDDGVHELDAGLDLDDGATDGPDGAAADPGAEPDDDPFEIEIDVPGADDDADDEEPALDVGRPSHSDSQLAGLSTTSAQRVSEDLEEAEFYYQQQLMDEAESIYRRVLKAAPRHPLALVRLGEIAAAKGDDPTPSIEMESAAPEGPEIDLGDAGLDDPDLGIEIDVAGPGEDDVATADDEDDDTETETGPTIGADADLDHDFDRDLGIDFDLDAESDVDVDDTEVVADLPDTPEADEAVVQMHAPPKERPRLAKREAPPADSIDFADAPPSRAEDTRDFGDDLEPLAAASGDDEGGLFDLAAELRDVIDEVTEDRGGAPAVPPSTMDDGFASIFADFKQGVSLTLSEDDYETRYDLGIAYREMELYADAIGEFQHCLASPSRKVASLHMMGLCALDLGQLQDASNHLQQALACEDLPESQRPGIQFDLARTYEALGDASRAVGALRAVLEDDPDFPGAAERLAACEQAVASGGEIPLADEPDDEGYESFDDLMGDDDEPADAAEPGESFESFDDVVLDAEPVESDAPDDAEPDPAPGPPKKGGRRKKISFV